MKRTCLQKKGQGLLTGVKFTANAAMASSGRIARFAKKGKEKQRDSRGMQSIVTQSPNHSLPIIDSMLTGMEDRGVWARRVTKGPRE
jgi:hypothetical protein